MVVVTVGWTLQNEALPLSSASEFLTVEFSGHVGEGVSCAGL